MTTLFYLAGCVAVLATLLAITRRNAVHALLYLIVSLLAVALVFFSLGAPFVAALEIIIYAGAILVLFLFVVMMLNLGKQTQEQERAWLQPSLWIWPSILAAPLLVLLVMTLNGNAPEPMAHTVVTAKELGATLFGPYVLAVELASLLLLAGLVGAYHLARK